MNQADANSPAAISGNSNKPDQKPSAEDFQSGKGAALSRILYCPPPQRDQNTRHVPEPADSVQARFQHRKIPVHTCGCQSVCKRNFKFGNLPSEDYFPRFLTIIATNPCMLPGSTGQLIFGFSGGFHCTCISAEKPLGPDLPKGFFFAGAQWICSRIRSMS